jgi:hypothetical protein
MQEAGGLLMTMTRPNELDDVPNGYVLTKTEQDILERNPWYSLKVAASNENGEIVHDVKDAASLTVRIMEGNRIVYEVRRSGPMGRSD